MKHILTPARLLIWIHERNTIKLHVQVCLRMNIWMSDKIGSFSNFNNISLLPILTL